GANGDRLAFYRGTLQSRFDASKRRGESLHLREEARFTLYILKDATKALEMALANWEMQREPADARILLEAALQAQQQSAAAPVLAWLDETGFRAAWLSEIKSSLAGDGTQQ
ncbi:MAG: hypothetical protein R3245_12925, partial [Kiloniellales bacterium]|nr:hypothetical protein [Kiloniellales bacterium]